MLVLVPQHTVVVVVWCKQFLQRSFHFCPFSSCSNPLCALPKPIAPSHVKSFHNEDLPWGSRFQCKPSRLFIEHTINHKMPTSIYEKPLKGTHHYSKKHFGKSKHPVLQLDQPLPAKAGHQKVSKHYYFTHEKMFVACYPMWLMRFKVLWPLLFARHWSWHSS